MPVVSEVAAQEHKILDVRVAEQKLCAILVVDFEYSEIDVPDSSSHHAFFMVMEAQRLSQQREVGEFLERIRFRSSDLISGSNSLFSIIQNNLKYDENQQRYFSDFL